MSRRDEISPGTGRRLGNRTATRVIAVLVIVLAAELTLGAIAAWVAVFGMARTETNGGPDTSPEETPAVSYRLLYQSDSFESRCYEALSQDFGDGLCPPAWSIVTWGLLPNGGGGGSPSGSDPGTAGGETASVGDTLSSVAQSVMLDHPAYASYLCGDMAFDVVGNRYRPRSCSATDAQRIQDSYDRIAAFVNTNYSSMKAISEGSASKYACVVYRYLSETIHYSRSTDANDIDTLIETRESGALGLALTMKALLDAGGIPNYVAYGTFVDTGLPHTWNVAWIDDAWFVFDVADGCQKVETQYPSENPDPAVANERWVLDSNIASIPTLLNRCKVRPDAYASQASADPACVDLQLRYEALLADSRIQASISSVSDEPSSVERTGNPKYSTLLSEDELRFYNAVTVDLQSGRRIDQTDSETWFISPVDIPSDEECTRMTEVAACAMYDNPVLSITNGGDGWSLKYQSKQTSFGCISRYFISSPISNTIGDIDMKMASAVNEAHEIFLQADEESDGDDERFVYAAYRDISANCLYADDYNDSIHHNDAYGALLEGHSKCYGLSCAMKMVLDEREIPNFIAFGTLGDEGHAWNMVFVDGNWYGCDLTTGTALTQKDYTNGTLNRDILMSGIDEMDAFYAKCMVPSDRFYEETEGLIPSELSQKLQALYAE